MKRVLKFLFLLLATRSDAQAASSSLVWNGKTDIKWYSDSKTEFTITTPEQLAGLAKLVNKGNRFEGKTVKLGANIMLNDTAGWQNWEKKKPKNKWNPIGFEKYTYYGHIGHLMLSDMIDNYFGGTFDGGGFAVSGVYVNGGTHQGLFGYVERGVIKNLGVTASYIRGGSYVSGLVGYFHNGKIINCHSNALVIGGIFVGGLAGYISDSDSRIVSSYSTGTVTGDSFVGGLVGDLRFYQITSSYSTGTVTGRSKVGGLVGDIDRDGQITNSYYSKETSGQSDKGKGEGKTMAEMKKKETFAGWDFDSIWGIDGKVNGGYPYLKSVQQKHIH